MTTIWITHMHIEANAVKSTTKTYRTTVCVVGLPVRNQRRAEQKPCADVGFSRLCAEIFVETLLWKGGFWEILPKLIFFSFAIGYKYLCVWGQCDIHIPHGACSFTASSRNIDAFRQASKSIRSSLSVFVLHIIFFIALPGQLSGSRRE